MFNDQSGAILKAYFNAVAGVATPTVVDDSLSLYSEFPVILLGFDTGISQDEAPTVVTVNFRISGTPTALMGLTF